MKTIFFKIVYVLVGINLKNGNLFLITALETDSIFTLLWLVKRPLFGCPCFKDP